jgi:KaiC/GvpD/RAD55 family RecA-like ATPase
MTGTEDGAPTEQSESKQRWLEDVQAALDRTGDAIRTAWESTRESRASALESAKQAAQELGEALDKGIAVAKERWAAMSEESASTAGEEE